MWPDRLPIVPLPTLGGKQLWADVFARGEWRVQESTITGHFRLLGAGDVRHASGSFAHCRSRFDRLTEGVDYPGTHLVVCLHGMFRTKETWRPMVRALSESGAHAIALNYPSSQRDLEAIADQVERVLADPPPNAKTVSFVTHSMGGLVARVLLGRPDAAWRSRLTPKRLVMIATPNRGADIIPVLERIPGFHLAGPALPQLHPARIEQLVPRPTIPFATIAGARGDPRGWNPLIPGDDDWTVTLQSVALDGAEDAMVIQALHTFIAADPRIVAAVLRYLETGSLTTAG